MRTPLSVGLALCLGLSLGCSSSAAVPDGLHVVDGGSTNAAAWTIALRSDANAIVTVSGAAHRSAHLRSDLTARTFADVKAARASGAVARSCVKSASFGSSMRVRWHGWTSPDLNCPTAVPSIAALAADVAELRAQARLISPQRRQLPPEVRRIPPSKGR
jgi:hypothetical protein